MTPEAAEVIDAINTAYLRISAFGFGGVGLLFAHFPQYKKQAYTCCAVGLFCAVISGCAVLASGQNEREEDMLKRGFRKRCQELCAQKRVKHQWHNPATLYDNPRRGLEKGDCVGYAIANVLNSEPFCVGITDQQAEEMSVYANGSILDGLKYAKAHGWISGHVKLTDLTITRLMCFNEPLLLGLPIYEGMGSLDWDGYMRPWGPYKGKHVVCLAGYVPRKWWWLAGGYYYLRDSRKSVVGKARGVAKLEEGDMEQLWQSGKCVAYGLIR